MSPRTGRPKSDNPKDIRFCIRLDAETYAKLKERSKRKWRSDTKSNRVEIDAVRKYKEAAPEFSPGAASSLGIKTCEEGKHETIVQAQL